jgi:predicted O-linked N-acetylglucosamine transferase (SPINDLY family)
MSEPELLQQGVEHHRAGRPQEAAQCYQQVLRSNPTQPDALYLLAVLAHEAGRPEVALELARRAIQTAGDQPRLSEILGLALMGLGRLDEAEPALLHASQSGSPTALQNLSLLRGKQAQLHVDRGAAFEAQREFADAAASYRAALAIDPTRHETMHNLAHALFELGQADEALHLFRQAAQGPNAALPRAMIAVMIPGAPFASNEDILAARRAFAQNDLPPLTPSKPAPAHAGPIRIGYVSSFFHRQNWMKPVWSLISHHDRSRFEIHLFSDAPESSMPEGYRADPRDHYHDISALSNEDAAQRIEQCGIDLLIDLNGYSKLRRLPLFMLRPAPVIIGWFNMFATTGMPCYDYLIGDETAIPPDEEPFYTEKILRVPGSYLTFDVTYPVPPVAPPPCLAKGDITFGCLAPLYKITPQAISVWYQILHEVPRSSLVLRGSALKSTGARAYLTEAFAQNAIPAERLQLLGPAAHFEFLETYNSIDIALDTFPYNGGTTTTEAIWQGVPVVTFWGDRWVSRTSASILRAANLARFVNAGLEDYIAHAIALATSPDAPRQLAVLRSNMRDALRQSPVCDAAGFARNMESIYAKLSVCSPAS